MEDIPLYLKLTELFHQSFPGRRLSEKSYDVTLFRNLMIFFLYQYKKATNDKKVNYRTLAANFDLKHHSTTIRAKKNIQDMEMLSAKNTKSTNFTRLYYQMAKIYSQNVK